MPIKLNLKFIFILALIAALGGCGNGGSDSSNESGGGGSNWDTMKWDQGNWA